MKRKLGIICCLLAATVALRAEPVELSSPGNFDIIGEAGDTSLKLSVKSFTFTADNADLFAGKARYTTLALKQMPVAVSKGKVTFAGLLVGVKIAGEENFRLFPVKARPMTVRPGETIHEGPDPWDLGTVDLPAGWLDKAPKCTVQMQFKTTDGSSAGVYFWDVNLVRTGKSLPGLSADAQADLDRAMKGDERIAKELTPETIDKIRNLNGQIADLAGKKDFRAVIPLLGEVISLDPHNAIAFIERARANEQVRNYGDSIADYEKAIIVDPDPPRMWDCHNDFAWLLATCPEAQFRDGKRAVALAQFAFQKTQSLQVGDTLAAAYAEAGDFAAALKLQQAVIDSFKSKDDIPPAFQERLDLYRIAKPYHSE